MPCLLCYGLVVGGRCPAALGNPNAVHVAVRHHHPGRVVARLGREEEVEHGFLLVRLKSTEQRTGLIRDSR